MNVKKIRTHVVTLLDGRRLTGSIIKEDPDKILMCVYPGSPLESRMRLYHRSIASIQDLGWVDLFDLAQRARANSAALQP
jgi:hypothetical protein